MEVMARTIGRRQAAASHRKTSCRHKLRCGTKGHDPDVVGGVWRAASGAGPAGAGGRGAGRPAAARARTLCLSRAARRPARMLPAGRAGEPRQAARAARCASRWRSSRPSAWSTPIRSFYLAGGPGDSPLVASSAGADPLSEGDWWNDTADHPPRRDVVIISQRGAAGSMPSLDCFESRATELGARPPPRGDRDRRSATS